MSTYAVPSSLHHWPRAALAATLALAVALAITIVLALTVAPRTVTRTVFTQVPAVDTPVPCRHGGPC